MFRKILISNRGEIACRIIRSARQMGITTVAVYSAADTQSLHVREADEAYYLGPAPAIDSYLNIDAILAIAKSSQAEAIHPGYGFLSENATFAQACADASIVFIGPSIEALKIMGSKQLAKQHLANTTIPLIPGYHGADQADTHLLKEAKKIGFPLLIKAANGGGGKGMREVHNAADFMTELAAARRESKAYFADDTIILEKLIQNPRHVEIQIMADQFGHVVHVFERDCSIQRRHQKVIEEAPAAQLSVELRQRMTDAAIDVAKAIHYYGAGTIECLVENNEHFYFMEMNTRLQVEHPVSEMISGLDLVAWQIKIAAKQPLPCTQAEIQMHGHAIECRLYAEDPKQDFLPSTGQIRFLRAPTTQQLRIDTGIEEHAVISMYYDPMIAKIIAWGPDRNTAIQRLIAALQAYHIGGIKTNRSFLLGILQNQEFAANTYTTHFLQHTPITASQVETSWALYAAAAIDYAHLTKNLDPIYSASFGWHMHLTSHWSWYYRHQNDLLTAQIIPINLDECHIQILELSTQTQHIQITCGIDHICIDNGAEQHHFYYDHSAEAITLYSAQEPITLQRVLSHHNPFQLNHAPELTAPMPGTVVAVLKNSGEQVESGEALMVLEAMKMEHTIHAPRAGKVQDIFYPVGSQVQEGVTLAALEPL